MDAPSKESSGVIAPPPLIYGAGIALGLTADWLAPLPIWLGDVTRAVRWMVGAVLFAIAGLLAAWAMLCFSRAGTPIPTWRPTTALVADGPYRFSRNPIYVALSLAYAALGIGFDNAWLLALLAPILGVVRYGVIAREERYLEQRFGDGYRRYKAAVRRWL